MIVPLSTSIVNASRFLLGWYIQYLCSLFSQEYLSLIAHHSMKVVSSAGMMYQSWIDTNSQFLMTMSLAIGFWRVYSHSPSLVLFFLVHIFVDYEVKLFSFFPFFERYSFI